MLEKYSLGVGDRFARQGVAQVRALQAAGAAGVSVVPVWNKSHREHAIIGSAPTDTRVAADAAVRNAGWEQAYYVDADHINRSNVSGFLDACDFFTLDVASAIGADVPTADVDAFVQKHRSLVGTIEVPGLDQPLELDEDLLTATARTYAAAVREAGEIYRRVAAVRGETGFVAEVSMDECDTPQSPVELLIILAALAEEGIRVQTIAPRFSGRFNKGVDYVGNEDDFAREFAQDVAVLAYARDRFGLPENLKLSVHSGSDKFAIYPAIRKAMERFNAGVHVKTAGTTWLEEVAGLAEAGGDGLNLAAEIYAQAWENRDALCAPYASVIDIDPGRLPNPDEVREWNSDVFVGAVRHDASNPSFNPDVRQLLHVGYRIAADMGPRFLDALEAHADVVADGVTRNLARHLSLLFGVDIGSVSTSAAG